MALDLNSISLEVREKYITVARRYTTSRDALDQIAQTLDALEKYGTRVEAAGL